ncbi:MAG: MBL fold metallo-hydrolase [Clostridiales bacterium]|nr:MBL fold metallo-hydrolase [Clostridiales bacterium]
MNNFKIRWIGQSGYILSDENTTIYLDPYLSDCVNRVAGRERMVPAPVSAQDIKADAFICTHNHLDHVDVDLIGEMNTGGIDFYAPSDCQKTLLELGVKSYIPFDCGTKAKIGDFEIEAVYADHTVPAVGVVITYGENRLYFTGDTFYNEKLAQVKCDILFVCINGKLGNMDVKEAVKLTKEIVPKTGVPNHYGMFESNTEDPHKYTDNINNGFIMEYNREYTVWKGTLK